MLLNIWCRVLPNTTNATLSEGYKIVSKDKQSHTHNVRVFFHMHKQTEKSL